MSVKIVLDSTTDLVPELLGKFEIVPLTVNFGEEEFIDGVTITREEFYAKLIESDVIPTTSQASPEAFERVFKKLVETLKKINQIFQRFFVFYGVCICKIFFHLTLPVTFTS